MQWQLAGYEIADTQISQGVSQPGHSGCCIPIHFVVDPEWPGCVWIFAEDIELGNSVPNLSDILLEDRET
jgi:hypothetical protein